MIVVNVHYHRWIVNLCNWCRGGITLYKSPIRHLSHITMKWCIQIASLSLIQTRPFLSEIHILFAYYTITMSFILPTIIWWLDWYILLRLSLIGVGMPHATGLINPFRLVLFINSFMHACWLRVPTSAVSLSAFSFSSRYAISFCWYFSSKSAAPSNGFKTCSSLRFLKILI